MTYDLQVRQRQDNLPELADPYGSSGVDGQGELQEGLFIKVHRLLRGRYIWAILLGLVLGGGGAYLGFIIRKPIWSATGVVQIRANPGYVLRPFEDSGFMNAFEAFRQTQASLLKQQRVVEMVIQSPAWRALNRPGTIDEVYQDFLLNLDVVTPPGTEMVLVVFKDPDTNACVAAVKGILAAYSAIYLENEEREQEEKLAKLDGMRVAIKSERDAKADAIRAIARDFGTDDLRPIHQAKQASLSQIENELHRYDAQLAELAVADKPTTQPTTQPVVDGQTPVDIQKLAMKPFKDWTVGDITMVDPKMSQLWNDLQEAELRREFVSQNKGPKHPMVMEWDATIKARRQAVERYAEQWRTSPVNTASLLLSKLGTGGTGLVVPDPTGSRRRQLEASRKQYLELIQPLEKEAKTIGLKMIEIEQLRQEEKDKDTALAEVVRRIETLRTEGKAAGRVRIVSNGDRPVRAKDPRLQFAVLLGMCGFGLGAGFFVMLGLFDRRMHNLDDARITARLPLLGILPELPQDLADPEQASMAAHCVHQIRTLLQIGQRGEERRTFAVTSPAAGTGKTSLTLALGVSFAAASSRTLMIDCDVIGGGLTARIETIIRRKIGQILKRQGAITEQQLETALRLAHNSQRKLGEILVELGYLLSQDVERALAAQQDEPAVGMLDALSGEAIEDCVAETGIQGLCILPVGGALASDVSKLSPQALRNLLARARERFDIILIDTGPVPGSLEASAAATVADGVILVVSRGEHRPLVERSLQYLHELGARLSGMVFNRAGDRDVDAATTTTRLTSFDRTGRPPTGVPQEQVDSKFGPVAGAVATSSPASKAGTRPQQP
ncbi:MAG: AAA family ATPase [Tepidisphaeraceae bacterium]|jgi:Mrp family chromosome partitioning ATPase/uncharacterized protein involved in exopolysaccharide biosynthesis